MNSTRGLVVSCPIEISGTSFHIKHTNLDPQELRFALLFWDKLDFPSNNAIHIGLGHDETFLNESGILQRTEIRFSGSGDMTSIFLNAHLHAYRHLNKNQPGTWSLAIGARSISFQRNELEEGRGTLVRLHNALPVPDKDVSLQNILEFRTKRRDELLSLRHHLETIYQRVVSAGDGELALNSEIDALQKSLQDYIKTSREIGFKFRLANFDANLNLIPAVITAFSAYNYGLPIIESLMTGLSVKFGPSLSLHRGNGLMGAGHSGTPYRYVSSYHNELFGS